MRNRDAWQDGNSRPPSKAREAQAIKRAERVRSRRATTLLSAAVVWVAAAGPGRAELALQTLYEFFPSATSGTHPTCRLVEGDNGSFYGTTSYGGSSNVGTIFRFTSSGSLTTVFSFSNTNGSYPYGGLALGDDRSFNGVTVHGGTNSFTGDQYGTVFKITTNGTLTTLYWFGGTNGSYPDGITQGSDGNFYGTTSDGGAYGLGTVFKMAMDGTLTPLVSFNGANGCNPVCPSLAQGPDGSFYGTTWFGGNGFAGPYTGMGTVFRMQTNGMLTTLAYLNGTNGSRPFSDLTLGPDQNFYGTTTAGGAFGYGTVFKLAIDGTLVTILSFDGTNGAKPYAGVVRGPGGDFYGTTAYRKLGTNLTYGTVFKITTNGVLTSLACLDGTNGLNPFTDLTLGRDGNLYGAMADLNKNQGLDGSLGSLFRMVSPPVIQSIARPEGTVALVWTSFTNGVCRAEFKSAAPGTGWIPIGSNVAATGGTASLTTPREDAAQGYYRIVLLA
jgi:uncharacterized repeat protein (TIGR03803 family)